MLSFAVQNFFFFHFDVVLHGYFCFCSLAFGVNAKKKKKISVKIDVKELTYHVLF